MVVDYDPPNLSQERTRIVHPDPARLGDLPLFGDLSDDDLRIIASWFEVEAVSEGRRIAPEGASGYQFYVIDEGTADVTHEGTAVASLGPGDHFGEMAMLGDGRRKADVASSSPMTIVAMFGTAFREMGSGYPALTTRIRATAEEPRRALTTRIHRSADP